MNYGPDASSEKIVDILMEIMNPNQAHCDSHELALQLARRAIRQVDEEWKIPAFISIGGEIRKGVVPVLRHDSGVILPGYELPQYLIDPSEPKGCFPSGRNWPGSACLVVKVPTVEFLHLPATGFRLPFPEHDHWEILEIGKHVEEQMKQTENKEAVAKIVQFINPQQYTFQFLQTL